MSDALVLDSQRALTENEARELTAKIYGAIEVAWELVVEAYQRRADRALGYGSWDDYCKAEFNGSRLRLPREERQEKVRSLRESGLSTRAIESATGVSRKTVRKDLREQVGESTPPADHSVTADHKQSHGHVGLDGKVYAARPAPDDVVDAEIVDEPKPDPTPKRRPLTDQARDAGWDLRKAVERLDRIAKDDRFSRNKKDLSAHLCAHLTYTIETCQDLLNRIDNKETP